MAGSFMQLDAQGVDQLRVIAIAMKKLPAVEIGDIADWVNDEMSGELQPLISERMHGDLDSIVYSGQSKITATASKVTIAQPVPSQKLRGGFKTATANQPSGTPGYVAVEFGADRDAVGEVTRRSRHGLYDYSRHTKRQLPPRIAKGRVFYPSVKVIVPRVLSMMWQTSIRSYLDCFGKE